MDRGDLVPDEVIVGVITERIDSTRPRTDSSSTAFPETPQAEALDAKLERPRRELTAAILMDVSDEEVVRRLGGRRTCEDNRHVFHVEFDPPEKEGVCDIGGSRADRPRRRQARGDPQAPREVPREDRAARRPTTTRRAFSGGSMGRSADEVADHPPLLATLRMEEDEND